MTGEAVEDLSWEMSPRVRLWLTLGPLGASAAFLVLFGILWSWAELFEFAAIVLAVPFYAGKFVITAPALLGDSVSWTPWTLALLVTWLDSMTACVVVANFALLYRIPWAGRQFRQLERYGRAQLARRPDMRHAAHISVVLFVTFPIAGTGAIGGAILGRMLGVSTFWILLAVVIGAFLGSFGLAVLAVVVGEVFYGVQDQLWFKLVGAIVIGTFIGFFVWRARKLIQSAPE